MTYTDKLAEIRPNQMITTYGPGAILDAVNDSLTILDLDYWTDANKGKWINDVRLASYMRVKTFYMPATNGKEDIPVRSFPYYHVCTKCKRLFDMRDSLNVADYKKNCGQVKCPDPRCGKNAYPARFITICQDGHMDDFPWKWWVHRGNTDCIGTLTLTSSGDSSSLDALKVNCTCGKFRSMQGAMQKDNFIGYTCTGNHPHKPGFTNIKCKNQIIPSQRGASNVFFGVTKSAISIPPWTDPINDVMATNRKGVELLIEVLGKDDGLNKAYDKYFSPKFSKEDFLKAYERLEQNIKEFTELKEMEYKSIIGHQSLDLKKGVYYFKAEEEPVLDILKPYISRVIKLHRLREVRVLTGFTRLEAPEPEIEDQKHICKLTVSKDDDSWLPATEINGEGIFIELDKNKLDEWLKAQRVSDRSDKYNECWSKYCEGRGWTSYKPRNGVYVLLHTLAHLLIKKMSELSGYSSSAMHERIYSSDTMHGLLIYTGAADKEGSLGGLVELGNMSKFYPLLRESLESALTCTTDPECLEKSPTTEKINGAACHSCCMISETACENGNRLLDRALVVPLEHKEMAYFNKLVHEMLGIQE